ncbi:MAG TPA: outer membrane protein assembly factor BamD [Candidatus Acidoferrales bacterium]|nr:outer membrane protein assembly factor BamD [Candidatus Acidoferrales bacterium]
MTRNQWLPIILLLGSLVLYGCPGKRSKNAPTTGAAADPDKVLFDRAAEDIKKGRYAVGRLTFQTLINTYPDSEYLAKAKLAIADSYYKEGGTAGLTQAVAEYKDFITFFPFLDEAAYAQMQVGMAHYRRMEKPDRDRTEGRLAEDEFQTFLQKYPNHPLSQQAEQRLREVQETLAEGDFRIARFYYVKGSMRAAGARLLELTNRYPLYSQADRAVWMLGNVFERSEKSDLAAQAYSRLVSEYPLSSLAGDAKERLTKLGVPIPQPNPEALARMQHEREVEHQRPGVFRRSLGIIRTGPDVSMAARSGKPNLNPPSENAANVETLKPGGQTTVGGTGAAGSAVGNSTIIETVKPGSPGATLPNNSQTPADTAATASAARTRPPAPENPPQTDPSSPAAKPADTNAKAGSDKKDDKKKKESSSKKKKGLRKIIPW